MEPEELAAEADRQLNAGDLAIARRIAERLQAAAPGSALAHNVTAMVETAELRHEDARRSYAAAVAAEPDAAVHRVNLAHSMIHSGEFKAAEAQLFRALELDPAHAAAYQHLVSVSKIARGDSVIAKLEELKRKSSREDALVGYGYALGKCYNDIGEYDLAFANYKLANDLRDPGYDRAMHEGFFRSVKSTWSRTFSEQRRLGGLRTRKPVFIVGMPRSGSTLLEQKLSARPDVAALGERQEIARISVSIEKNHPRRMKYPYWCADLPLQAFAGFGGLYVDQFSAQHPIAERFVDKNLVNFAYVGLIRAMLPDALIIESRRNPIDTCLSCYFSSLKPTHGYSFNLAHLGHFYRVYADLMDHWRATIDGIVAVDYERFIENADAQTQSLWTEMGLAGRTPLSDDRASHINTLSAYQARQPVYTTSAARWRHYEKHIGPLIEALGQLAGVPSDRTGLAPIVADPKRDCSPGA